MPTTYPDPLTQLTALRDGYLSQLAADAALPAGQASYSLDGESVSRQEWREGVLRMVDEINRLIIQYSPFEMRTVAI